MKNNKQDKDETLQYEQSNLTQDCHKHEFSSSPQLFNNKNIDDAAGAFVTTATITPNSNQSTDANDGGGHNDDEDGPPPIPPLPVNYQRSDGLFLILN